MNFKEARELSIKKWEIVARYGLDPSDEDENYELVDAESEALDACDEFQYNCPFCEIYISKDDDNIEECFNCPLSLSKDSYSHAKANDYKGLNKHHSKGCCQDNHPWSIWNADQTKENAMRMLELIKNCKEK